jgi:hypothetical protein
MVRASSFYELFIAHADAFLIHFVLGVLMLKTACEIAAVKSSNSIVGGG